MSDLTLPAFIPGLIRNGTPLMVWGGHTRWPALAMGFSETVGAGSREWLHVANHGFPNRIDLVKTASASVDLTDATGRDHAAKCLGRAGGDGDPLAAWMIRPLSGHRWSLGVATSTYLAGRIWALDCPIDLDPNDDTRLPDGSRRVDAEALRLVMLHVFGSVSDVG